MPKISRIEATEVQFVIELNDRADIRAGGAELLGPYCIVPTRDVDSFKSSIEAYLRDIGKWKFLKVVTKRLGRRSFDLAGFRANEFKRSKTFLANEANW